MDSDAVALSSVKIFVFVVLIVEVQIEVIGFDEIVFFDLFEVTIGNSFLKVVIGDDKFFFFRCGIRCTWWKRRWPARTLRPSRSRCWT